MHKTTKSQRTTGQLQIYQTMHNGSQERDKRVVERTSEQILAENVPNLMKNINLHI